jgi:predicted NBD/HSP70 family sugar kinase
MSVGKDYGAVCSITQDEGEMLAAKGSGKLQLRRDYLAGPFMSSFSSWGPTSSLAIKPEITAHGGEILSAVPGNGYERLSGTSMACPNQAGATALIRQTRHAMVEDLNSALWQVADGKIENVDGRTAFIASRMGDATAKRVIDQFVGYLSEGIADFVNILRPEAIVLGGGIANEGEALFEPLRKAVDARSYIAMDIVPLKIVGAQLGSKAGIYGAFAIAKDKFCK